MSASFFVRLPHRALIAIDGEDCKTFLHGLVSANILTLEPGLARYGAFLTTKGRFLYDFFAVEQNGAILLDTEADQRDSFIKRLSVYKLRSKVTIAPRDDLAVFAISGQDAAARLGVPDTPGTATPWGDGLVFADPRLAEAGLRAWLPENGAAALEAADLSPAPFARWDAARLALGLPDGSRDMVVERTHPLEAGFDELGGVDWEKGCYLGQEQMTRTKFRGELHKRLIPVAIDGEAPPPGTTLTLGGEEAGQMASSADDIGLAMIRLEVLKTLETDGGALDAPGGVRLTPRKPAWIAL